MQRPRIFNAGQSSLEDDRLLQLSNAGDQRAFELLVEYHSPWLIHLIRRMVRDEQLAQDILQQVWLQFYLSLSTLRVQSTLTGWLARVAHNRCIDELRRKRMLTFSDLTKGEEESEALTLLMLPDPAPLPEEILELMDLQESLQEAIDALPPRVRSVVVLRLCAQFSYGEIGQTLEMPISTAKTIYFRAKRLLRASCQIES